MLPIPDSLKNPELMDRGPNISLNPINHGPSNLYIILCNTTCLTVLCYPNEGLEVVPDYYPHRSFVAMG